ncbi:hypothetical protein X797_008212 [Metarhizium robertsii]|uniref:Uncharacterized protein n=2 Tax=Metarhizium robertsii TaxID=568076 RepID=E9F9N5_METRA|nr:uncharacterized protein MAA_08984 [Metarhizium robertsii ARSEF 23]EFY95528.1 hypothetical protein MAA_08984 [Metarhizium robertsii ARSEF 23]EXU98738.1 hypothetical protein X797_008212 [Metarhizium robertsii]
MMYSTSNRKGGVLLFLFSLLSSLLLFSSQSGTALGAPVSDLSNLELYPRNKHIPNRNEVVELIRDGKDFHKYAKEGHPHKDKAAFFTGQNRQTIAKIRDWAKAEKQGLTTVRDIWKSDNFYQQGQYKDIDAETFRDFQKAFSKYYAQQAKGKAYLIFPHDQTPKRDGIFWSVELDEIISHGKVDVIIWLDQNKIDDAKYHQDNEERIYWKKGERKPDGA